MRHALKFVAIAVTLLTVGFGAQAKSTKKQSAPSREQFVQIQANEIATDLNLDESTARQFVATFTKCQQEIWNCGPKKEIGRKQRNNKVTTDAEAEKIIKERFEPANMPKGAAKVTPPKHALPDAKHPPVRRPPMLRNNTDIR